MEISEPDIVLLYYIAALIIVLLLPKKHWCLDLPSLDERLKLKFKIFGGIWNPVTKYISSFLNRQSVQINWVYVMFAAIHKYVLEVVIL